LCRAGDTGNAPGAKKAPPNPWAVALEVKPRPLRVPDTGALFGRLGDDSAGDPRRRGAAGFGSDSVDDHRGTAVAEDGVAVVAERDVRSNDGRVSGAVGADDQREVRDVACGKAAGGVIVVAAVGIEMRTGGLEVRAFALGELVDVEGVFAGRKIFDVELDADAVRSLGKRCAADDLILSVFDFDGERLGGRRRCGVGNGCRYR